MLADVLEWRPPLLPGVLPRLRVPLRWRRLTPLTLLAVLALVSVLALVAVLALLGVLALLHTRDLLLGWLEGAVFVLSHLVDLELLGLVTELGAVDGMVGTEELLGTADSVAFKAGGGMGDTVGTEGAVDARDLLGCEDLVGGEDMVGAKGLVVLEVPADVKDLVALDDHLIAFHRPIA